MHRQGLPCLAVKVLNFRFTPVDNPSSVSDDREGVAVDCLDLILPVQFGLTHLSHSFDVFLLRVVLDLWLQVLIVLQYAQILVTLLLHVFY